MLPLWIKNWIAGLTHDSCVSWTSAEQIYARGHYFKWSIIYVINLLNISPVVGQCPMAGTSLEMEEELTQWLIQLRVGPRCESGCSHSSMFSNFAMLGLANQRAPSRPVSQSELSRWRVWQYGGIWRCPNNTYRLKRAIELAIAPAHGSINCLTLATPFLRNCTQSRAFLMTNSAYLIRPQFTRKL